MARSNLTKSLLIENKKSQNHVHVLDFGFQAKQYKSGQYYGYNISIILTKVSHEVGAATSVTSSTLSFFSAQDRFYVARYKICLYHVAALVLASF